MICPDGQSECPDGNTCCIDKTGHYKCCNAPLATCCSDNLHCCPHGFKCMPDNTCQKAGSTHPVLELISRPLANVGTEIKCPDNKHFCDAGQTCCRRPTDYGCCYLPNAVCCSDLEHCCPTGKVCDAQRKGCVPADQPQSMILVEAETNVDVESRSVVCPDGESTCQDGYTCCKVVYGYGCCPLYNAVCCSDEKHCCPSGSVCDDGKCISLSIHPFLSLLTAPVKEQEEVSKNIL